MRFSVFGLGDTSYEQFNTIGKMFNETLEELGGERVYKYGEGNAEGNHTEDHFNEWKAEIWIDILKYYKALPHDADIVIPKSDSISPDQNGPKEKNALPLVCELLEDD